jgi:hypothetical protein
MSTSQALLELPTTRVYLNFEMFTFEYFPNQTSHTKSPKPSIRAFDTYITHKPESHHDTDADYTNGINKHTKEHHTDVTHQQDIYQEIWKPLQRGILQMNVCFRMSHTACIWSGTVLSFDVIFSISNRTRTAILPQYISIVMFCLFATL